MIPMLDSSFDAPNLDQAREAFDAGIRAWGGYLATQPNVGLAAPWTQMAFMNVHMAGMRAIAFCSGFDDPVALGNTAAAWGVTLCLDCEDGIRGDGSWVDGFLAASGAGLYGLCEVHYHAAPFHIVARYPGFDPGATWDGSCQYSPGTPRGWQWQGTHTEFGLSVDRSWLDDQFLPPPPPAPQPPPPSPVIVGDKAPVSTSFGPTSSDSFAAGYYSGQPAPNLFNRQVWTALVADETLPGATFPTQLRVWYVPRNWTPSGPSAESHDVTLSPSQQVSVMCGLIGEVSVRIQFVSGGPYVGRVYEEFTSS